MTSIHATKINYTLLNVGDYKKTFHEENDPECAICYKHISKTVFVCEKPCTKTFHPSCMEKLIEQLEDNTTHEAPNPDYRCCYCRRKFDIHQYDVSLFLQELKCMEKQGYYVKDAIAESIFNSRFVSVQTQGEYGTFDVLYEKYNVYRPVKYTYYIKFPKISKRAEFKNKKRPHYKVKGRC